MKKSTQNLSRFLVTLVVSTLSYLGLKRGIKFIENNLKNKNDSSTEKK